MSLEFRYYSEEMFEMFRSVVKTIKAFICCEYILLMKYKIELVNPIRSKSNSTYSRIRESLLMKRKHLTIEEVEMHN